MIKNHIFDRYLKEANGNATVEKRVLGNFLREEAEKKAEEWKETIEQFLPAESDVEELPGGSWLLQLEFTLLKPFTSKSEGEFHHYKGQSGSEMHNPIVRDHLTGLPVVKPTTWKGHLRFASRMSGIDREIIDRLFGLSKGDESGQAGRLHFFPTFFTADPKQEVITPLRRNTRTPTRGPLYIEVIPKGSAGTLSLLYIPWPKGHDWFADQVAEDLKATAKALKFMLLEYGFSAKKTSGWGVVKDKLEKGTLTTKGPMWPELQLSSTSLHKTYSAESITAFVDLANQLAEFLRKEINRDGPPQKN